MSRDDGTQAVLDGLLEELAGLHQRMTRALPRCSMDWRALVAWEEVRDQLETMAGDLRCANYPLSDSCVRAFSAMVPCEGYYCADCAAGFKEPAHEWETDPHDTEVAK